MKAIFSNGIIIKRDEEPNSGQCSECWGTRDVRRDEIVETNGSEKLPCTYRACCDCENSRYAYTKDESFFKAYYQGYTKRNGLTVDFEG